MTIITSPKLPLVPAAYPTKSTIPNLELDDSDVNPVVESAGFALKETTIVSISNEGVKFAAAYIHKRLFIESYTPRTWRTHPLHILPPEPYSPSNPRTTQCLNWIFLISSLNFSFWSEKEGYPDRFGIEWRTGWGEERSEVHTGYWSLVAAIDRALEEGIPFADPSFYASETLCPDALIAHVFRPASRCDESIPLLKERISIMREVGSILTTKHRGSFQTFIEDFQNEHNGRGTALQLVKKVTDTFPSFRDEVLCNGKQVFLWKRAQILVAETWAAFHPPAISNLPHPLFPAGPAIHQLTMFADYRVPQILHHLRILTYPPSLLKLLKNHTLLASGCQEELSIRAASIIAVERVRKEMLELKLATISDSEGEGDEDVGFEEENISSVMIDFFLWDLAKRVESGDESIEGICTAEIVPAHRTRSIWY